MTAASGTIVSTAQFGTNADTTSGKVQVAPVTLKKILSLVSNTVAIQSGTNVPASAKIAYDLYTFSAYLTNATGFSYNLSGILSPRIDDIATSLRSNGTASSSENDLAAMELDVKGTASDGLDYEFNVYGLGNISGVLNSSTGNAHLSMSLSNGAGYGQARSSADGVSKGGFSLSGSGTVPADAQNEPYSVFWWNNQ